VAPGGWHHERVTPDEGHRPSDQRPSDQRAGAGATAATEALDTAGIAYRVITHGPVRSLAEAATARGVEPSDVVKTLVVRRGEDDFLFVLVPGDRTISWPKLRARLGVSRLSMPDAEVAKQATGYERGTITPFGSATAWPVIADERLRGRHITLGAGEHDRAVAVAADEVLQALAAVVADVSDQ
jgi:Cys-tRNA(Pro)/Cys-tRNA(Cys) deacylase